jgi:hypothetical protein
VGLQAIKGDITYTKKKDFLRAIKNTRDGLND